MKIGFTTLSMFMDDNLEIIKKAHEHNFEMIEILGESPFFKKENTMAFKDCGLEVSIHAPTVDINIASLNEGIRAESLKQMKECIDYAESINAHAVTVHAGKIGRNDPPLRNMALELACESISELVDYAENVIISVENLPVRQAFLGNKIEELELFKSECGCNITIDVGHGNTTGNNEELLELKDITYCHLNDNDGVKDQHIALGDGTLDLSLLKRIDKGIIELNNFNNILKSKKVIEDNL
ncbi:sugar phosphate isomerase/epimerase family protein [Methanobrevibacter millerae]|uniref:Sugar phosphate isomerase/epimerase n=1 Tax=Methanobrevibacter millerae TaxID=230361 RepID=A0A1G5WDZ1_9EURY|nr:sugar phosphate isomerase/epimerase family protein [Methanobrevibacter millerae]SDA56331.1 Sugar phosphate isomerase/epimerase [Methanobrevibacter millerae]